MRKLVAILLSVCFFASCHSDRMQRTDTSGDGVHVFRYDRLQYEAITLNSFSALQKMSLDFPQATKILIEDVLVLGDVSDPDINERMCAFYSDSVLLKLIDDVVLKFSDLSFIEEGLTKGFHQLKKEVPSISIPQIYTQISALNQSVVVGDSLLGISLDKYMGEDYPLYRQYYYTYQCRTMNPDRILPDCFSFYLLSLYPFEWHPERRTLLDLILHSGKINWVVRHILDMKSNEAMLGYTEAEIDWCKKNGNDLWEWMCSKRHLSSTDPMLIRAYTHPDPSVIFQGEKIPPLIGIWVGMKLVEQYMNSHPDVTIAELFECNNFGQIEFE